MAANARSSSSGVRNLRAMFESGGSADDSTSPPPRGRSPARENAISNGTTRPLSKVRTSFVAVERSGQFGPQLGLKKTNGDNSVDAKSEANGVAADKSKVGEVDTAVIGKNGLKGKGKTNDTEMPLSSVEEPKAEPLPAATSTGDAASEKLSKNGVDVAKGAATAVSAAEIPLPDTPKAGEKKKTNMLAKGHSSAPAKASAKGKERAAPAPNKITQAKPKETAAVKPKESLSRSAPPPITVSKDTTSSKPASKAPALKIEPKPNRTPKTPTSPNKPSNPNPTVTKPRVPTGTASEPTKTPTKKSSRASMAPSATIASSAIPKPRLPTNTSNAAVPKQTMPSPPKPKVEPKSPTRPVRLPTSVTAPTASSAAKKSTSPSRPVSQASANVGRQPSTTQRVNKLSPARPTTTASIRRQPSRPSLPERPRSRNAATGAKTPSTVAPDEGFLARMMRPTASSASKTHEKVHDKVPEKTEDKAHAKQDKHEKHEKHEKGDGKVAKAVKKTVKSPRKSGGGDVVVTEEKHVEPECKTEESVKETEQLDHHEATAREEEKPEGVEEVKPIVDGPKIEDAKIEQPTVEEDKVGEPKEIVEEDQVEDAPVSETMIPQETLLVTAE